MLTVTRLVDVTVPFEPDGAEAVTRTVTGGLGKRVPTVKAWPVLHPVLVLEIPFTAVPSALLVNVQFVLVMVLMSTFPGVAVATRQNGTPLLADTDWDVGDTVIADMVLSEMVMLAEPVATPFVAVTVASPAPTPVTNPAADTVAIV